MPDDALVIAGKGHEDYQIVGTETRPFSDRGEAVKAALALGGSAVGGTLMSTTRAPLWTSFDAATATGGKTIGRWVANGVSIDTRTLEPGDLFVALTGESRDGHEFVADALKKGAAAALVSRQPARRARRDAPLLMVGDTQAGLEGLGRAARARSKARIVAVTGSAGKTTTKEMLRLILARSGSVAASAASYNNHWGVPLVARAHAARARLTACSRSA